MLHRRLAPYLWIVPTAAFLCVFLIYPVVDTARISFLNEDSSAFVGLDNYTDVFGEEDTRTALLNNLLWVFFFTSVTIVLGLLIAVLTDRVRYESAAKAVIFIPMAISMVAAGVIWKFMYVFQPDAPGFTQWGTLNAALTAVGGSPVGWLVEKGKIPVFGVNNFAIIFAGIWMWTGFAMVILSAGLKGIPTEILEAARVDGATERQIFWRITIPMLSTTIAVVGTTLVIIALKTFDLVFVMTAGNFDTDVVANRMWSEMFVFRDFGVAGALAVILLFAVIPVMLITIRRFRRQEEER